MNQMLGALVWAGAGWVLASGLPWLGTKVVLPDVSILQAPNPALWAAVAAALGLLYSALKPKHRRGYGSGENNRWNRRIRTERPKFQSKHHKLEHVWVYQGAGAKVDMDKARSGPTGTVTAVDSGTDGPLSGHLIGRQTWQVASAGKAKKLKALQDSLAFDPSRNANAGDKLLRAQLLEEAGEDPSLANPTPPRGTPSVSPEAALALGWDFYEKLMSEDGHWAGDYGGPLFLGPGLVIACYAAGVDLGPRASAMLTYMRNHQQTDGGWGLHIEGPSTLFPTTMNYMAARLLGVPADDLMCVNARAFMYAHGAAPHNPHWGKFWMAVLGCYDWRGVNPIPPELWLLPSWFPFHPAKMWCHSRMPYLPMSYIYGARHTVRQTEVTAALRRELFHPDRPYEATDWDAHRNTVATGDLYAPHTWILDAAFWAMTRYEKYAPAALRSWLLRKGVDFAYRYVEAEDVHTNFVCIGPVNKVANMLAVFFARGAESEQFRRHLARMDDYLWVAEDGMKMQGYNGSQAWDTSFAVQALAAAGPTLVKAHERTLARAYAYLDATQIKEDVPRRAEFFRTISKGGWPFSTNDHGWPIADCTSEGIKATLAVRSLAQSGLVDLGAGEADGFGALRGGLIAPQRYYDAVEVLLAFHNADGGWATYEEMRGGPWFEFLNPAEVWGDIMIDYTYTELTSACVTGLVAFQRQFPTHKPADVSRLIGAGTQYVRDQQREDGSWYGSWAVCFTYGTWFGVEALVAGGQPDGRDREALRRACAFLLSKQRADGGWGESYLSCLTKSYADADSQVIQTAWALLALVHAQCPDGHAVRRGIDFLVARQTPAGDWAQELVAGIFNRTCSITYTAYRNVFPLWALAAYANAYRYKLAGPVETPGLAPSVAAYHAAALEAAVSGGAGAAASAASSPLRVLGSPLAGAGAGAGASAGPQRVSRGGTAAATPAASSGAGANAGAMTPPGATPRAVNSRAHPARSRSRSANRVAAALRRALEPGALEAAESQDGGESEGGGSGSGSESDESGESSIHGAVGDGASDGDGESGAGAGAGAGAVPSARGKTSAASAASAGKSKPAPGRRSVGGAGAGAGAGAGSASGSASALAALASPPRVSRGGPQQLLSPSLPPAPASSAVKPTRSTASRGAGAGAASVGAALDTAFLAGSSSASAAQLPAMSAIPAAASTSVALSRPRRGGAAASAVPASSLGAASPGGVHGSVTAGGAASASASAATGASSSVAALRSRRGRASSRGKAAAESEPAADASAASVRVTRSRK